jgi:hypothetical protein
MSDQAFRRFVELWVHPDYPPQRAVEDDLDSVEARFETYFPTTYRSFMLNHGALSTGDSLSRAMLARRSDIPVLQEIFAPREVIEATETWRSAGLDRNFVAFASEGGGDMYCFEVVPENAQRPADAVVWYFDHEERTVECLDVAFSNWLELYTKVRRAEG